LNIKTESSGYNKQDFIYEVGNYTRVVVEEKFYLPIETKIPLYREKWSTIYSGKQVAINLQQPVHKRQKLIMPGAL
jgi:hypothetical protein